MSGLQKESRTDPVAGSSTMIEPSMMVQSGGYFNTDQPTVAWTGPSACSQLCRMCATENEYLIPIFEGEGVEHQLGMKIEKHLPIRVHVGDTLPLHVCYQCASTLIAWHDLVVGCIEAEKKLLQIQTHGRAEAQVEEVDVKSADSALFFPEQMDTEPSAQPSTSGAINVPTRGSPKKTVPKANPKLKMVIVKTPTAPAAASSRIVAPKTEAIPDTAERWTQTAEVASAMALVYEPSERKAGRKPSAESADDGNDHGDVLARTCNACGKLFKAAKGLSAHAEWHARNDANNPHMVLAAMKTTSCCYCHVRVPVAGLVGHKKEAHPAEFARTLLDTDLRPMYVCNLCGPGFLKKAVLQNHLRAAHDNAANVARKVPRPAHACDLCGLVLTSEYMLRQHMARHARLYLSALDDCD